jgi:glycosyltransferase involved in cell wall biosynthesis
LRVALDTTYAGVNTTGVGLYSARLASELRKQAREMSLDITCFGSACKPAGARNNAIATFQEWPTYTHGILPARLLAARPQIVHSTSHIGPLWGPGKLIITVHDLIFMRYPQDYQRGWLATTRLLLPVVLRRAKAIIADSHATGRDIQAFFGVSERKIVVIYPGIDPPESVVAGNAPAYRSGDGRPLAGAPYILCLGPWVRRKNLEVVVKAFALLAHDFEEISLVITGDTSRGMKGYTQDELFGLLPARFHNRLHLAGYVSQERRNALVSGASALCYPSRFEGFGLPPLEAMAAGVPVLASDTPAVAEVTAGAALLADPDDAGEWAQALRRLWEEPVLAEQLRTDGLRRSAEFTWPRCALETARLYRRVAQRKSVNAFT